MLRSLLLVCLTLLFPCELWAKSYSVNSASEIHRLMKKLNPGDEVLLAEGLWNNQHIKFVARGTAEKPILLKAETPGKTILTGNSFLYVDGTHVHIQGLHFYKGQLKKGHVIRLSGHHHQLVNSAVVDYNPEAKDTRYFWLSLYGSHHKIHHNYFAGQTHSGVTNVVWLKERGDGYHTFSYNHYGPRRYGKANGFETIRIGTGKSSHLTANTLVEHNLFDACDGEMEIISNKSNGNVYRFNTFNQSAGTLTIRQGKGVVVAHNHFVGQNKRGTGGVRVIGTDHLVYGNHFEGLGGRAEGVLSLTAGTSMGPGKSLTLYPQVKRVLISANRIKNSLGSYVALEAGLGAKGRKLHPQAVYFSHNYFEQTNPKAPLIKGAFNASIQWLNNIAITPESGYPEQSGLKVVEPGGGDREAQEKTHLTCLEIVQGLDEKQWNQELFRGLCHRAGLRQDKVRAKKPSDVGVSWQKETL